MERTIGELESQIHSKKAPFANLASLIYECQLIQLLCLYYPELDTFKNSPVKVKPSLFSKFYITKKHFGLGKPLSNHSKAISETLTVFLDSTSNIKQWRKFKISDGVVLRSQKFECRHGTQLSRSQRYFESYNSQGNIFFGEALAFYSADSLSESYVVYHELMNIVHHLGTLKGTWSTELHVAPTS